MKAIFILLIFLIFTFTSAKKARWEQKAGPKGQNNSISPRQTTDANGKKSETRKQKQFDRFVSRLDNLSGQLDGTSNGDQPKSKLLQQNQDSMVRKQTRPGHPGQPRGPKGKKRPCCQRTAVNSSNPVPCEHLFLKGILRDEKSCTTFETGKECEWICPAIGQGGWGSGPIGKSNKNLPPKVFQKKAEQTVNLGKFFNRKVGGGKDQMWYNQKKVTRDYSYDDYYDYGMDYIFDYLDEDRKDVLRDKMNTLQQKMAKILGKFGEDEIVVEMEEERLKEDIENAGLSEMDKELALYEIEEVLEDIESNPSDMDEIDLEDEVEAILTELEVEGAADKEYEDALATSSAEDYNRRRV